MNATDLAKLMQLYAITKVVTSAMRKYDLIRYAAFKAAGEKEFARLQKLAPKGEYAIAEAMKGYEWTADKIDYIPENWKTCYFKKDDCDGSAWLLSALTPGTIYLLGSIKSGQVKDFDKWHYIFYSAGSSVWSNYKLVDSAAVITNWVKKKYSWANFMVSVKSDLSKIGTPISL